MLSTQGLLRLAAISSISLLLVTQPALLTGSYSHAESSPTLAATAVMPSLRSAKPDENTSAREVYGKLPLAFEANRGQTDAKVRFLARTSGYSLFLTDREAVLSLRTQQTTPGASSSARLPNILRMRLVGANKAPHVSGENELDGKSNYFIGNDQRSWRSEVPNYRRVRYADVYSGVDQLFYGNAGQLEYDFVVAPGNDYKQIQLKFDGAQKLRIDEITGELVLRFADGSEVRQKQPYAYQEIDGERRRVDARYVTRRSLISFKVEEYDRTLPLVIDPILIYSTYLGGSGSDIGNAIAVDSFGNAYVTGETQSSNFPTTNPGQPGIAGGFDAFVTKINVAGSARVYSTFLGGNAGDEGNGIAVDSFGNAYVTGSTASTNFPITGAIQATNNGSFDAFVTKINAAGTGLFYSTYLGGSVNDIANGIALDSSGNAYIAGSTNSANFPVFNAIRSVNAGGLDAFIVKINSAGSGRFYSTYLGGAGADGANSIAVDSSNNAYITGSTSSNNFPTAGAIQSVIRGGFDAFTTKIHASGISLVYSTYLGGVGEDVGRGIAVDTSGHAYVSGYTFSFNFPTFNAVQATLRGAADVFVTKFNATGSGVFYSTYLGGINTDGAYAIAVDQSGSAHVTGFTQSNNFPVVNAIQPARGDSFNSDAFVTKFTPAGSALIYSTYLGGNHSDEGNGIDVDANGNVYVTGVTFSTNFPLAGAIQPINGGGNSVISNDAFVTKIFDNLTPLPTPTPTPNAVQLSASTYTIGEAGGNSQVIVNRTNTSAAATVDYITADSAAINECNQFNGMASARCDYTFTGGTLRFAAGESSKTIFIPIIDDSYAEGNETFSITLSNPTGATLGTVTTATITIQDNETVTGANPIDGVDFFIRQHYLDFLGRDPDPAGLAGWRNVLNNCGITVAPPCDRIEVSAGFFRSEEFLSRGYFIYRFYSALGRIPLSEEFYPDFAKVSGFLTAEQLEANKVAFVNEFMARAEFQTKYAATFNNPTAYVDALLQAVGLPAHPGRAGWIQGLTNGSLTRAQVLRQLVESPEVFNKFYNEAFVIMQYFGYLRRTADASYLNWLTIMNSTGGDYRIMINGFINSAEYRRRFGP